MSNMLDAISAVFDFLLRFHFIAGTLLIASILLFGALFLLTDFCIAYQKRGIRPEEVSYDPLIIGSVLLVSGLSIGWLGIWMF